MNIHKSGQAGLEKFCQGFCTLCGTPHAEQIRDERELRNKVAMYEGQTQSGDMKDERFELRMTRAKLAAAKECLEYISACEHSDIDWRHGAILKSRAALKELE